MSRHALNNLDEIYDFTQTLDLFKTSDGGATYREKLTKGVIGCIVLYRLGSGINYMEEGVHGVTLLTGLSQFITWCPIRTQSG